MNCIYEVDRKEAYGVEVSVICCFRNVEKFINNSISSIIAQNSCPFEILLLDYASEDSSLDICVNLLKNSNVPFKLFKSDRNVGVPSARNFLIKQSIANYIAIHDADDHMLPYRLAIQYNYMINNPGIDILGSHAIKIGMNDEFIGFMSYPPRLHDDIVSMLCGKVNPMIDPTIMMKRLEFLSLGLYSLLEKERLVQDFDMWIRACMVGKKMGNIQIPLISYRFNENGLTQQKKEDMIKAHVYIQTKYKAYLSKIKEQNVKKQNSNTSK